MAYSRRIVTDGVTIMNKDLYDNLQDGIDEAMDAINNINLKSSVIRATLEDVSAEDIVLNDSILTIKSGVSVTQEGSTITIL